MPPKAPTPTSDLTNIPIPPIAPLSKRITSGPSKRRSNNGQPKTRPFVAKLWSMVNDKSNDDYIHWMADGNSFEVVGRELFEKNVLPKYFKHSNFSSFVRQLNMYGWHKVQDVTSGAMQTSEEKWQFQSPNFIRDREDLLDNIVRNRGSKGSDDEDEIDLHRIFEELNAIKENQVSISQDLYRIRKDNELLWTENFQSQERHKKHAETLDRILRFLASIYGNQGKLLADIINPMKQGQRLLMPGETTNNNIVEVDNNKSTPADALHDRLMSIHSSVIDPITEIGSPESVGQTPSVSGLSAVTGKKSSTPSTTKINQLDANNLALTPYDTTNTSNNTTSTSNNASTQKLPDFTLYNDSTLPNIVNPEDNENPSFNPSFLNEKILDSSKDIEDISRHIASQGTSLQQVQDWIQKIVPTYVKEASASPPEPLDDEEDNNSTNHGPPLDSHFNVDEFLVDPSATPSFDMANPIDNGFNIEPIDTPPTNINPSDIALPSEIPPTHPGPSKKRRKVSDEFK